MNIVIDTSVWSLALRRQRTSPSVEAREIAELIRDGRAAMLGRYELRLSRVDDNEAQLSSSVALTLDYRQITEIPLSNLPFRAPHEGIISLRLDSHRRHTARRICLQANRKADLRAVAGAWKIAQLVFKKPHRLLEFIPLQTGNPCGDRFPSCLDASRDEALALFPALVDAQPQIVKLTDGKHRAGLRSRGAAGPSNHPATTRNVNRMWKS
jgi:hypothetical protein